MAITLERLKTFEPTVPAPGHISIAAARHDAPVWPSSEVNEYAKQRADVLHRLVDEWGVVPTSWGSTDKEYPSEVAEIIVPIVAAMIGAVPGLMALIASKSKGKEDPSVPGFKWTNSRGESIMYTCEDRGGEGDEKMLDVLTAFIKKSSR
jgi:hypothetical protein